MEQISQQQDSLVLDINIAAPPARVFEALTNSEQLLEWWGDDAVYRCESWTVDLKVGGRYRSEGKNADGRPFWVEGEYLEIDPPRKLSYTWKPSWEEMGPRSKVEFILEDTADGTHLTITHSGFEGYPEALENHRQGWPLVLGSLRAYAEAA